MTEDNRPVERAIELLVYAPLGFALFLKDVVPPMVQQFVSRGRGEVEQLQKRVDNQVTSARIVGQYAVQMGGEQVRNDLTARVRDMRERGEELARTAGLGANTNGSAPDPAPEPDAVAPARPESSEVTPASAATPDGAPGPDPDALAIPDYDELSASQVVARLAGLATADLEAVRAYEAAQRGRKTVLNRIDQLVREP